MGLRQRGSVIGNYATASNTSASGIWTGKEAYTLQKKGTWQVPPTFTLSSSAGTVNEGASVNFILTTTGIANGTVIPYTISGTNVTTADSANNILTGNFVISNGSGTVSFNASADVTLEGTEIIQMTAVGQTANVTINDTSFPTDAQFPYTVLLLNGDGTNNAQNNTFLDSSTNSATITRNGNPTQGSFSPYANNWSWYFDGSGDYLVSSGRANIATGEFTIETWVYPTVLNAANMIFENANWDIGQNSGYQIYIKSTGVVGLAASAGAFNTYPEIYASSSGVTANKWSHIAITRDASNVIRCFINGVLDATTATYATSLNLQTNQAPTTKIGVNISDGGQYNPFTGYISNLRIVNGAGGCLYTTSFTPSTTPLTAISNTKILACQANRFIDNSSNRFTFTRNGDVSVEKFSPFKLSSSYSTTTFGGSGYFDGTGDYLTVPYISSFNIPLNTAFTLECWVYTTTNNTFVVANRNWPYGGSGPTWAFYLNNGITPSWGIAGTGVNTYEMITSSISGNYGAWNHYVWTRDGGNVCRIFVNGIQGASRTDGQALTSGSGSVFIGVSSNLASPYATGNMSNMRFVSGMAVYTGNFTPPSAPVLTSGSSAPYANTANVNTTFASANTSLLCNFTNAGIYDGTMISDFETAGDSKVSSTQSKFGGTALYFDGTGDYLVAPASSDWALGPNCTVEFWIYPTSAPVNARVLNNTTSGIDVNYAGGVIQFCNSGYTSTTLPLNNWTHVACVLNSGTMKIYFNGQSQTLIGTTTGFNLTATNALWVGGISGFSQFFQGYLDDVRITKGFARYTTNFTVPTSAFGGI